MLRSKVIRKTRFSGTSRNENFILLVSLNQNVVIGSCKLKMMLTRLIIETLVLALLEQHFVRIQTLF